MNFLCILQVSRFVFVLKTNFYSYFSVFNHLWTGPQFSKRPGISGLKNTKTQGTGGWTAGGYLTSAGSLMQNAIAKGYDGGLDRWITSARCGLNRLQLELVRDLVHRISDQWLRSIMRTIRSRPSVNNPTARTSPSRTGTLWFDQDRQRIIRRPAVLLTMPHPNVAAPPPPCGGPSPEERNPRQYHTKFPNNSYSRRQLTLIDRRCGADERLRSRSGERFPDFRCAAHPGSEGYTLPDVPPFAWMASWVHADDAR
jgi:hypothetical protein